MLYNIHIALIHNYMSKMRVLGKLDLNTGKLTNKTIWYYISYIKKMIGLVK